MRSPYRHYADFYISKAYTLEPICCFTVHILGSLAKSVTVGQITLNEEGFRLC